ncbi:PIG-L deacetylase family protein [Synechococcus sp. UW179A]|uniref:PIG-L deacetylase family protein n=1 Tax=Synechococcus sp. UW179A TaxID=2575510 RepID=UPI000E0E7488|nr:PIG-L deacetylase family protein [Synechococcus sp. UW179A]
MVKSVLIVAPHPDDEVLGCGGAISYFSQKNYEITVLTVAAHMPPLYSKEVHEITVSEAQKAHQLLGVENSIFLDFPAVMLSQIDIASFNKSICDVVVKVDPQILFIPFYDRHIDHRLIFDSCLVASRPIRPNANLQLLACYETISESFWNAPGIEPQFTPNWFLDITAHIDSKCNAMLCYQSQVSLYPGPRSVEALRSLALFRGSQHGFAYAEAFHIIRMHNIL